ncbi:hypothetical protein HZS_3826, partial [Henneguya salminicola]
MKQGDLLSFFNKKTESKKKPKVNQLNKSCGYNDENEEIKNSSFLSMATKRRKILNDSDTDKDQDMKKPITDTSILLDFTDEPTSLNTSFNAELYQFRNNIPPKSPEPLNYSVVTTKIESAKEQVYPHHTYQFLLPNFKRDKEGRQINNPDFDPTTLQLPSGFLSSKETTPAMKQWWKIKSENFDTVLFFKMGKFYELFHMDADIGVKELGLIYMKGKSAHAGFPETSFATHASALVEKGYKVARIEQTEKPSDVSARIKETGQVGASDKLVRRDLCNIMSPATRIFDSFDLECDNRLFSRQESLNSVNYDAQHTIKDLFSSNYFSNIENKKTINGDKDSMSSWPPILKDIIKKGSDQDSSLLCVSALGPIIYKLKRHLIDEQIISVSRFSIYTPYDSLNYQSNTINAQTNMVIDDNALRNLDVIVNSEGYIGKYGTILSLVNHCVTPSGKRHMFNLVCHPLFHKVDIDERLDAIEDFLFMDNHEFVQIRQELGETPDLERLLFRLNSFKVLHGSNNHPQNNAIIFNEHFFNKKKVDDLISVVSGFEKLFSIYSCLKKKGFKSRLILNLLSFENEPQDTTFKTLEDIVAFFSQFKSSFDIIKAKREAIIIPHEGFIPQYDNAIAGIKKIESELQDYLEDLKNQLNCKSLKYWGSDRSRYLIEIPTSMINSNMLEDFELKSQRKGFKRYSSHVCQDLLSKLIVMEETRNKTLSHVFILLIEKLITHKHILIEFVKKISMIDCLMSFAYFSSGSITNGILTRPKIAESSNPFIEIKNGYHPCLSAIKTDTVSNNLSIGTCDNYSTTMLITGPNMGGKSTLMRQTAIIVILAQLGCYVPSSYCTLTPVDRIFARLGASFDHPNSGESTFFVELAETSVAINRATSHSLILLDELGRGTATHDGLAIAYSILKFISQRIKCRTLFSTHYHYIARDLNSKNNLPIQMAYMECMVNEDLPDTDPGSRITFLYKVKKGICPKSYGFHVARLAGMPENIVQRAINMAKIMERNSLINEMIQAKNTSKELDYL